LYPDIRGAPFVAATCILGGNKFRRRTVFLVYLARIDHVFEIIGAQTIDTLSAFGRFGRFAWQMFRWLLPGLVQRRTWVRAMPLFYEIGNRTVPVIAVTGTFVGLVLAIQSYDQLQAAGFEQRMGVLVSLTLVQELGPVLAGIMVAGRVGGALTAELGTMRVTEQINALTVMGADPIRYLVVPRFLACLLLTPLLTFFCDLCGSLAGWFIAVQLKNIPSSPYWYYIEDAIQKWDMTVGFVKSLVFGGATFALRTCPVSSGWVRVQAARTSVPHHGTD